MSQWNNQAPTNQQTLPTLLPQSGTRYISVPTTSYDELMRAIMNKNKPDHVLSEADYQCAILRLKTALLFLSGPAAGQLQTEIQRIENSVIRSVNTQIQTVTMPYNTYVNLLAQELDLYRQDVTSLQQSDSTHTVIPYNLYRWTIDNATRPIPIVTVIRAAQIPMMQAPPQGLQTTQQPNANQPQGNRLKRPLVTLRPAAQTQMMRPQPLNQPAQVAFGPAVQAQFLSQANPGALPPAGPIQMWQAPALGQQTQGTLGPAGQTQMMQPQSLNLPAQGPLRPAAQTQMAQPQPQNLPALQPNANQPQEPSPKRFKQ